MVPTLPPNTHNQDEEEDDAEDVATGTDTSSHREGKSAERKPNNYRSKHSETEQRRRSKINERFQILRELIPPNDQKRDKASLLLEVIEYVQFLQEKLQVYEGSYQQVWSQEPTKLIPWRASNGPVDNYANCSLAMKNGGMEENTSVQSMTTVGGPVESEVSREYSYRVDHSSGPMNSSVPLNVPLQPCTYPPGRGIQLTENLVSNHHGSSTYEVAKLGTEERTFEKGSSSVSDVYSQGLLNKLTQALQSSGVDVAQANISVQLDICKQVNSGLNALASTAEVAVNQTSDDQLASHSAAAIQVAKRLRTEES